MTLYSQKADPISLRRFCLSLDYESFKNCLGVSRDWKSLLAAKAFQKKVKSVFKKDISEDEDKLLVASEKGDAEKIRKLLSSGLVEVNLHKTRRDFATFLDIPQQLQAMATRRWSNSWIKEQTLIKEITREILHYIGLSYMVTNVWSSSS